MTDSNDKLFKPSDALQKGVAGASTKGGLTRITGKPASGSRLADRIAAAGGGSTAPPTMPTPPLMNRQTIDGIEHRLALLLDCSYSMGSADSIDRSDDTPKIEHLKEAVIGFGAACDWSCTATAFNTFPHEEGAGAKTRLSASLTDLLTIAPNLQDHGGTPMAESMREAIEELDLTRAIMVSDGHPDNPDAALEAARFYASHRVPIDCLHIGTSSSGEKLLKEVAEITGGIFIKFDNAENFAKALAFLTPSNRAKLFLAGAAHLLGAKEIIK